MNGARAPVSYPIKILQLTDTHLFADDKGRLLGVDTRASLEEVISLALREKGPPDLVLLTGDLSQDESEDSYRRLKEAVKPIPAPKYYLPGNHDHPDVMAGVFAEGERVIELERELIWGRWQIVLLDSTVPGQVGGHLRDGELKRVQRCLETEPERFALICLHHQPVPIGCHWIDTIAADNGAELLSVVERYPNVRAILWGHVHQRYEGRHKGIRLMASPSTCVQFMPLAPEFAVDPVPPGYRWIELGARGEVESDVYRLDAVPVGLKLKSHGY